MGKIGKSSLEQHSKSQFSICVNWEIMYKPNTNIKKFLENRGNLQKIRLVTFSSIFKNLSINWEKYVKWKNFELIGYSVHITDFLALVKVLLT